MTINSAIASPCPCRRVMRRRGFTLIELLVVTSIVVLLISILLPALSGARRVVRDATCLSNLRQIAIWGVTYAQENREYLPYTAGATFWVESPPVTSTWADKSANARLFKGVGTRSGSVLHCPQAVTAVPMDDSPLPRGFTYGLNEWLGGDMVVASAPRPKLVHLATRGFWFGDARADDFDSDGAWNFDSALLIGGTNGWNATPDAGNWPWTWNRDIAAWSQFQTHSGRKSNFVFGDGHASGFSQEQYERLAAPTERRKFTAYPFP